MNGKTPNQPDQRVPDVGEQRSDARGRKSEVSWIIDLRPLIPDAGPLISDVRSLEPDKPNKPYKLNKLNELYTLNDKTDRIDGIDQTD